MIPIPPISSPANGKYKTTDVLTKPPNNAVVQLIQYVPIIANNVPIPKKELEVSRTLFLNFIYCHNSDKLILEITIISNATIPPLILKVFLMSKSWLYAYQNPKSSQCTQVHAPASAHRSESRLCWTPSTPLSPQRIAAIHGQVGTTLARTCSA